MHFQLPNYQKVEHPGRNKSTTSKFNLQFFLFLFTVSYVFFIIVTFFYYNLFKLRVFPIVIIITLKYSLIYL